MQIVTFFSRIKCKKFHDRNLCALKAANTVIVEMSKDLRNK